MRARTAGLLLALLAASALAAPVVARGDDAGAAYGNALASVAPGIVLWVGAHPDDEVLLAPLLGEICVVRRHPCALLVATRGENGACRLPGGCHPDLAAVRSAEMRAAAKVYDARLLQGSLPDVAGPDPAAVRQSWDAAEGRDDLLLGRLATAIESVAPRTIITFDPRHGTTCHNAHRAIGRLVLEALDRLKAPAPEVYLLEDRVLIAAGGASIRFLPASPGDPALLAFDANTPLRPDGTTWDFLLDDARRQPSQFNATFLSSMLAVPATHRYIYMMPAADLATDTSRFDLCDP
jgi:LmbE family N-acetylglucosaminyl deacetylase